MDALTVQWGWFGGVAVAGPSAPAELGEVGLASAYVNTVAMAESAPSASASAAARFSVTLSELVG